jgi:pimeloyl-ACP methyl ester carboxylesterase
LKRYYISNEKINVHITEWGNNDKPVIFCLHGLGSTSLSFIEVAVKDLGIEMDNKVWWHARGNTASNIIRGMHKDETIDIYEKLPANIVLLRATVPQVWADYRDKTVNVFKEKTDSIVKVIPDTTHMLHWDKPEIVIAEIKNNWS